MQGAGGQHRLLIGALVSVLVHVAAVVALGGSFRTLLEPDPAPAEAEEAIERVRLGLERSRARTIDWIGYETYQEHLAPEAENDQAAMALGAVVAGAPEGLVESSTPQPPAAPSRMRAEQPPAEVFDPFEEPAAPAAPIALDAPREPAELDAAPEQAEAREPAATSEAPTPTEQARPAEQVAPARPAPPPRPGVEADNTPVILPGNADKEADPTSRTKAIDYRLGQPLAAEGLDIKTVRPRFSIRTSIMSAPRNPLVRIHFNRSGAVARVETLQSSGYDDVDRPLLDAIYNWRAEGAALAELADGGDDATIPITLRIRLR